MWVVEVNGRSVGFVQDYRIGDYPDYAVLGPDPDGDRRRLRDRRAELASAAGSGARMLWAWMLRARSRFPEAASYFAAPDHRNAASLRILAKAGFVAGSSVRGAPGRRQRRPPWSGCRLDVAPCDRQRAS